MGTDFKIMMSYNNKFLGLKYNALPLIISSFENVIDSDAPYVTDNVHVPFARYFQRNTCTQN